MILADKIIALRKKNGWSQEELAEMMNVSRQSVSKWEGAQSVPDLNKIILLSQIFGVSTDYLLKEELEEIERTEALEEHDEENRKVRYVSMEEANEFLEARYNVSGKIAAAVYACILSPISLLLLGVMQETGRIAISENAAGGIGLIVLLLMVAAAVAVFVFCGLKINKYEYMEKEEIDTAYGVTGMVKERQRQYQATYTKSMIIGVCFCILAVLPLFAMLIFTEEDFMMVIAIVFLLVIVGLGVMILVTASMKWESLEMLLQEGDYTVSEKAKKEKRDAIGGVYWLVVTAIFLAAGFWTDQWNVCAFIWPVAGVLFAAIMIVYNTMKDKK